VKRWLLVGLASITAGVLLLAWRRKPVASFLFVSDTHGAARYNAPVAQKMLQETGISAVFHGGDIVDSEDLWSAWWDQPYADVISRWPVYAAEGNHDLDGRTGFERRFGNLPTKVRIANADIFVLPWHVYDELRASTARTRILVVHHPLWSARDSEIRSGESLRVRLEPCLPYIDLVLAGHQHVSWDATFRVDGHEIRQIIEKTGPKNYECSADAVGCIEGSTGYVRVDLTEKGYRIGRRVVE